MDCATLQKIGFKISISTWTFKHTKQNWDLPVFNPVDSLVNKVEVS